MVGTQEMFSRIFFLMGTRLEESVVKIKQTAPNPSNNTDSIIVYCQVSVSILSTQPLLIPAILTQPYFTDEQSE